MKMFRRNDLGPRHILPLRDKRDDIYGALAGNFCYGLAMESGIYTAGENVEATYHRGNMSRHTSGHAYCVLLEAVQIGRLCHLDCRLQHSAPPKAMAK
jgi:hypothetical protein